MCCTRLAENTGRKKSPFGHHRTSLIGYIFATKACIDNRENVLNNHISSTCPRNMDNFGPLTAEMYWRVWSTPTNFNRLISRLGFITQLPHRRCSTEVNKTSQDVWPSGLVHYIYIFGGSCPLTEFCHLQNSLCIQVLRSTI